MARESKHTLHETHTNYFGGSIILLLLSSSLSAPFFFFFSFFSPWPMATRNLTHRFCEVRARYCRSRPRPAEGEVYRLFIVVGPARGLVPSHPRERMEERKKKEGLVLSAADFDLTVLAPFLFAPLPTRVKRQLQAPTERICLTMPVFPPTGPGTPEISSPPCGLTWWIRWTTTWGPSGK